MRQDPFERIAEEFDRDDLLNEYFGETKQQMVERWDREYPHNGNAEVRSLHTGALLLNGGSRSPGGTVGTPDGPPEPSPLIKSSKEFVAGFVPPDYLVDGLLQEAFLYSLTGATGAGKTAITLRLAASVALGVTFANREIKSAAYSTSLRKIRPTFECAGLP